MAAFKVSSIIISRKLQTTFLWKREISKVVVIGGGFMGSGIAQVCAQSGYDVIISDLNKTILNKSLAKIKYGVEIIAKNKYGANSEECRRFVETTLGKITMIPNILEEKDFIQDVDLILETITENLIAKKKLFKALDKIAPEKTIFASNTSSLSISKMAEATKRSDRFGGLHFFIPVPMMELLEVIRISDTSQQTYESLIQFGEKLGKKTITCKDTPGFIVNRLYAIKLLEALRMLERGDATLEDIDNAIVHGVGYKIGPLKLADYIGLDTVKRVIDGWQDEFMDNPIFKPSPIINNLVKEGKLGVKSGEGFYKYNN